MDVENELSSIYKNMRPIRRAPVSLILLEEIALEGLEGITLSSLWAYLSLDLDVPLPFTTDVLQRVWEFIKRNAHQLEFYELPTERPTVQLESRFSYVDPDFGAALTPDPEKFPRYNYAPIEDGEIMGSCQYYKERIRIEAAEISDLSAEATFERWGNRFVIVASQNLRYCILTPRNKPIPQDLTVVQYCVWEAIGRSRYNGETTSGPYSLLQICKESSLVFYIKNKLIHLGLIVQQHFTEFREGRVTATPLLNLAQYVPDVPRNIMNMLEKIYDLVKATPGGHLPVTELRTEIPHLARSKSAFRGLIMAPFFQRIFEVQKKKRDQLSCKGKEISVLHVSLRNPEKRIGDLIQEIMDVETLDEENELADGIIENKHSFVDMPLKEQFYRAILRHGTRGCSLTELNAYLGESYSNIRLMAKVMMRGGLIVGNAIDEGRQRLFRYVAVEVINSTKADEEKPVSKPDEVLTFRDLPPVVSIKDNFLENIVGEHAGIEMTIEECIYKMGRRASSGSTARQLQRRNYIIQQLNEHALLSLSTIHLQLRDTEQKQGITEEICMKSTRRIVMELKSEHNVKTYEITLKYQGLIRTYRYVAHPQIDSNHQLFRNEINSLKDTLLKAYERLETLKLYRRQIMSRRFAAKDHQQRKRKVTATQSVEEDATGTKKAENMKKRKPPKFLISRYMHEFLFYIVVELNEHQKMVEIDEQLLQTWTVNEPSLQVHEFLQCVHAGGEVQYAYTPELSWRTFITPLSTYADKPAGWLYFMDAIDRMPLSIFSKIFRLQQTECEKLNEYLSHPIRQHYLMRQLPVELQNQINRQYLKGICTMVLKLLNHMGLIQINDSGKLKKDFMTLWVYLNRRTQILDTTSSEASYAAINTARKYEELQFHFSTFDDVTSYWNQMFRICVYTKLGVRISKYGEKKQRQPELVFLPGVDFDDAPRYDTGEVPGNRAGAAGLSTYLFAHTIRNWSWVLQTKTIPPKRTGRTAQQLSLLRSTTSKHLLLMGMRKSRRYDTHLKRRPAATDASSSYGRRKTSSIRDAIDSDALKNMRTLRVLWEKREDEILKLARAVYIYISPPLPALGLLVVAKVCRDVLRHNLGICHKTTQACYRRIQYLVKLGRHIPEVPAWVHLLQNNAEMQNLYGDGKNFLKRLKTVYPNREEYCEALTVHFIKVLYFLYKLAGNTGESLSDTRPQFIIPDTLEEFDRLYIKCPAVSTSDERTIEYKNPSNESEALTILAIGVLHSSLCCALDKTTYTAQAFEIFKKFSEEVLENAYSVARNGGLIVANKRRHIEVLPKQLTSPVYSFSAHYQRRLLSLTIPYFIYDSLYGCLQNSLTVWLKPIEEASASTTSKAQSLNHFVEFKSPSSGQLFFIAENLARNLVACKVKLPINILTMDTEQKQTLSADRILDHYPCVFDNSPETEYSKHIDNDVTEKQVRVKFHPANLSYKITYTPYDFISKLAVRHLHFFCALDNLGQEVDINFGRLMQKDSETDAISIECPFNCILKHVNYINAIERIVQEKRSCLKELSEIPPQKLLNMAMSGCSVTVELSNLLTLVRMLESFWREKEAANECKDLGRLSANLKSNKSIDWHQLCCEILEFNETEEEIEKTDEYEPTLNKEERLARAQDVFVVNLPTLQLEPSKDFRMDSQDTVRHNGFCVPKRLVEADIDRDAILRKIVDESHWKYTDNTFAALKPKLNELGFTVMEQQHIEDLLGYIESQKLGVTVTELLREFPYVQFLSRALRLLSEHYLIKRVGIATMMYVYKSNIRPWVVHTFHIKRLERENLGPEGTLSLKRPATDEEGDGDGGGYEIDEETVISNKKPRLEDKESGSVEDQQSSMGKRIPKPVKRFESENVQVQVKECKKDVIVMKPHVWIRLNGTINRRVLDRWLGSILNECVHCSGCMVMDICSKFPHLTPTEVMFLLEILCDLKCIHLTEMKPSKPHLFSSYETLQESIVADLYDPQYTYITAHGDAITRMSIFIGNKKYSKQFF